MENVTKKKRTVSRELRLNKSTLCGKCGHDFAAHCESNVTHWDAADRLYRCTSRHCTLGAPGSYIKGNGWSPCPCPAFVHPVTGKITPLKRPTTPETPCGKCGHPKKHHCRKNGIGIEVDGKIRGCRHLWAHMHRDTCDGSTGACDSTACAESTGTWEAPQWCNCSRFVNPYLAQRPKKQTVKSKNLNPSAKRQETRQLDLFPAAMAEEVQEP
jgi:hypothetical protein